MPTIPRDPRRLVGRTASFPPAKSSASSSATGANGDTRRASTSDPVPRVRPRPRLRRTPPPPRRGLPVSSRCPRTGGCRRFASRRVKPPRWWTSASSSSSTLGHAIRPTPRVITSSRWVSSATWARRRRRCSSRLTWTTGPSPPRFTRASRRCRGASTNKSTCRLSRTGRTFVHSGCVPWIHPGVVTSTMPSRAGPWTRKACPGCWSSAFTSRTSPRSFTRIPPWTTRLRGAVPPRT
jgi:hypothetical protein